MKFKLITLIGALTMAVNTQAAPLFNIFELGVAPKAMAEYDQIGEQNIMTSLKNEQGTLAMYSLKSQTTPDLAYMVEIYADQDAYQTHINSPQYKAFAKAAPHILTDHKKRIALKPELLGDKAFTQQPDTQTNLVIVDVKPESAAAFRALVLPEMAQALKVEDGVQVMYAGTAQDNPNRWYFFEIYRNEQAYQTHRQTTHFQAYLNGSKDMVASKEAVQVKGSLLKNKGALNYYTMNK